jgi:hypothetical protein
MRSAFLSRPGSTLAARVRELVRGACAFPGPPERVQIEDRSVLWNGVRLDGLEALFVEAPLVAWPQPAAEPIAGEPEGELERRGFAARERRSLHVSALRVVAQSVRVANDPARAAELAASTPLALERLELAGVPVRSWRVLPGPSGTGGWAVAPLASEHGAREAASGPCLEVELGGSRARAHLAVAGSWIAAGSPAAALDGPREPIALECGASEHALVLSALAALGLDSGLVHLAEGGVALVSAAPDLLAWDEATDGRVARAVAAWLDTPRTPPTHP